MMLQVTSSVNLKISEDVIQLNDSSFNYIFYKFDIFHFPREARLRKQSSKRLLMIALIARSYELKWLSLKKPTARNAGCL